MEKRVCPECGELIKGRVDKKFCSDMCRNAFNNKANSDSNNYIRNINNSLRRNRRILEESIRGEKSTIPKQKLVDRGFNFKYYTHRHLTGNNHHYFYCYEFGYLPIENEYILIVKNRA